MADSVVLCTYFCGRLLAVRKFDPIGVPTFSTFPRSRDRMAQRFVRHGPVPFSVPVELKATALKHVLYAARKQTGIAVSICDLRREETDQACDCFVAIAQLPALQPLVDRQAIHALTLEYRRSLQNDNCLATAQMP